MTKIEIKYHRHSRKKDAASFSEDTEVIDLSGLDILDIDLVQMDALVHLRKLNLSRNRLEEIDISSLSSFSEIEFLDLSNNKLLHFDTSLLDRSKHLRELRLNRNLLKGIKLSSISSCRCLEVLDISYNHIHSIDLSGIEPCSNLRELDLSNNHLEGDIDLSPLSASTFLESIDLSHNWIRSLDTTPLKGKPSLRTFIVNQNPLSSLDTEFVQSSKGIETFLVDWTQVSTLDLSPLADCKNLKSLGVPQDKIPELDFYPIMDCQLLESLTVSGINSSYIDLWPLFGLPRLSDLTISSRIQFGRFPFSSIHWPLGLESIRHRKSSSYLKEDIDQEGFGLVRERFRTLYEHLNPLARYHLRVAFIEFFDLGHLRGFDGDLLEIIRSMNDFMTFEEAHRFLNDAISRSMIDQVKSGGSTHFIDLNQAHSRPVFAVIASEIVESRRREMNCVSLIRLDEGFDLTELWYTVYGQEVLSALGIGSSTGDAGILRIRHELKKVGIESFGTPDDCNELSPTRLSDELRAYLRFLAIRTSLSKN